MYKTLHAACKVLYSFHGHGQGKVKSRAHFSLRLQPDAAAVAVHDVASDKEPQPQAVAGLVTGVGGPKEALEYSGLLVFGYAHAEVAHRGHRLTVFLHQADLQPIVVPRILDGVLKQVAYHLLDEAPVGLHKYGLCRQIEG